MNKQEIQVLFEDDDMLAVFKPAGISVHHDGKDGDLYTVADWFVEQYPDSSDVGEPILETDGSVIERPGIVHRLDKDTSGVLLLAKTTDGFLFLKEQFKNREIKKTYFAFVYGRPKDERGVIDKPIGRAESSIRKWAVGNRARGELRNALTRYKVLKNKDGVSLLEVWPLTGRTHQIRVHLSSIGHPIIADALYAGTREKCLGFERLALHAERVVFKDLTGKTQEIHAEFPHDFEQAFERIGY